MAPISNKLALGAGCYWGKHSLKLPVVHYSASLLAWAFCTGRVNVANLR
jgi:hypothetical protein